MQETTDDPYEESALITERRESERRPPIVEPTYVWVNLDNRIKARVVDTSDGGIGIIVDDCKPFEVGFKVRVEKAASRVSATVMYICESEPEGFRVGLAWEA